MFNTPPSIFSMRGGTEIAQNRAHEPALSPRTGLPTSGSGCDRAKGNGSGLDSRVPRRRNGEPGRGGHGSHFQPGIQREGCGADPMDPDRPGGPYAGDLGRLARFGLTSRIFGRSARTGSAVGMPAIESPPYRGINLWKSGRMTPKTVAWKALRRHAHEHSSSAGRSPYRHTEAHPVFSQPARRSAVLGSATRFVPPSRTARRQGKFHLMSTFSTTLFVALRSSGQVVVDGLLVRSFQLDPPDGGSGVLTLMDDSRISFANQDISVVDGYSAFRAEAELPHTVDFVLSGNRGLSEADISSPTQVRKQSDILWIKAPVQPG
jgi:hypothetical protein